MRTTRLLRFHELVEQPTPPQVLGAAGMISPDVRRFLYSYAMRHYSGTGVIIDAGIFLGASTLALGFGVRGNPRRDEIVAKWTKPIKSYERAIYRAESARTFKKYGIAIPEPGGSFEPAIRERIAPVESLVELTIADITKVTYTGEPIEILFLDVLKSPEIHQHIMRSFFTKLVPGAMIDQQDYFIEALPYIKATQEYLAPYFDFVGEIRSDALFQLTKPIPADAIEEALNLSIEQQLDMLDAAKNKTADPFRKTLVELCKVNALNRHDRERAGALFDSIASTVSPDAHWRLHHACDKIRHNLGRETLRPRGGWRPQS